MSIGNLKDTGNQGNNMPWQWNVLKGLQGIINQLQQQLSADVTIVSPLDNQPSNKSVSVVLTNDQFKSSVTPNIILETIHDNSLGVDCYSISFASNGTADAEISFDGGLNFIPLPTGTTINMDAGGLAWAYPAGTFYWKTLTNAGASLIITYNN